MSLRHALEEGGVTFVKFGQLLSTRRDLLPEEFTNELARLQDQAEPAPWEQVEELISRSLGAPAREVFAELQPEPAAAASIAEVHKAWLRCEAGPGATVAVKVQRPEIRATVEKDLDILLRLAARLEEHARWARAVGAVGVARGFGAAIREELDFRVEARNMAAVAATWKTQQRVVGRRVPVVIPAVHEELCTEHVLVIEWLDGINLRAAGPLIEDKGLDRAALARALLRSMVYQITEGGVFHADPHPGNVLLLNLLSAVGRGDPAALRDALLELVTRPDDIDEHQLERALGRFMARHLAGGDATAEARDVARRRSMRLARLRRSWMVVLGFSASSARRNSWLRMTLAPSMGRCRTPSSRMPLRGRGRGERGGLQQGEGPGVAGNVRRAVQANATTGAGQVDVVDYDSAPAVSAGQR